MTDQAILAWVIRFHDKWIERSPVSYADAVHCTRAAIRDARDRGLPDKSVRRCAALALLRLLEVAGPRVG